MELINIIPGFESGNASHVKERNDFKMHVYSWLSHWRLIW